jgi:nicotinate dehydrogenase subunit B
MNAPASRPAVSTISAAAMPAGRWLGFAREGRVEVKSGKVELGQGIGRVAVHAASVLLGLAPDRIDLVAGDTDTSPDEWYTAGSQSVEASVGALVSACRAVRVAALVKAAAKLGLPDAHALTLVDGVIHQDGRATGWSYWTLPDFAPEMTAVTPDAMDWAPLAKAPAPVRADASLGIGGFIHDMAPPGLVHARVLRPPAWGAKVDAARLPDLSAEPGFAGLVQDGGFLAVMAEWEWTVVKLARRLAAAAWTGGPAGEGTLDALALLDAAGGETRIVRAGPPQLVPAAEEGRSWSGAFSRQPLLHASLAPSCALAQLADGLLTVWTHSQGVFQLRQSLAAALGRPLETIRVMHRAGAGCYGHNGADDAAFDAAFLAVNRDDGRPVRVLWSREDEFAWSPAGPPMTTTIEAGLDGDGRIERWALTVTSAPHGRRPGFGGAPNLLGAALLQSPVPLAPPQPVPAAIGGGAERNAEAIYDITAQRVVHRFARDYPVRTSSMRALGAHLNIVAIEAAMDELAALTGDDPVAFRLAHLTDPRAGDLVARAAAAWGDPVERAAEIGSGRARGFGFARYKNKAALMAIVVEVAVEDEIRLLSAKAFVDCGLAVDPDGVLNQVEGGIVQSASFTLKEATPLADGRPAVASWEDYPIIGFADIPPIAIELADAAGRPPLGVGEVAAGPTAAAIANAASRALGARLTDLPLTRERIIAALQGG